MDGVLFQQFEENKSLIEMQDYQSPKRIKKSRNTTRKGKNTVLADKDD